MRKSKEPVRLAKDPGIWDSVETRAVYEILEWDEDIVMDMLDRVFTSSGNLNADIEDASRNLAFLLEDELRSDIRLHYIDVSMWAGLVLGVIEKADFFAISKHYLDQIEGRRQKS